MSKKNKVETFVIDFSNKDFTIDDLIYNENFVPSKWDPIVRYFNPKKSEYYDLLFIEKLKQIEKLDKKPSLLLHACCGPCTCYPLSILYKYFDITILYENPNIYPIAEYKKRYETLKRFVEEFSKDNNFKVNLIKYNDDFETYIKNFESYKDQREGMLRCQLCHEYRLKYAIDFAVKNEFDYVTTTMTVSTRKPSKLLNEIGLELTKKYNSKTKYLVSDFKKRNGCQIGIEICNKYNLYRQDYCGCNFSYANKLRNESMKDSSVNEK